MNLCFQDRKITHGTEIINGDIYFDPISKGYFKDTDISIGSSLIWREEKVWTQVIMIDYHWYVLSPATLMLTNKY